MATSNLFGQPAFKDGAFTSNDRRVRRAAIGKAMRAIDLGAELDAETFVFWGGREGTETGAAKDPRDALDRYREAVDVLCDYSVGQGYGMRFAIEPKPNEPRGDIFLPTVGHALHFISTLQRPEMVGVNPEVAHETMAGLSFHHAVGQALWAGKLFHIDLNGQRIARYDQDFRFGAEDLKEAFLLVRLIERAGYDGPRHFDAHAYRSEDADGVWDFARGCMRTYLALAERARQFDALPEVQEALAAASAPELAEASTTLGADEADTLKAEADGLGRAGAARLRQRGARPAAGRGPARPASLELRDHAGIREDAAQRRRGRAAHGGLAAQLGAHDDGRVPRGREHALVQLLLERGRQPGRQRGEVAADHDAAGVEQVRRRAHADAEPAAGLLQRGQRALVARLRALGQLGDAGVRGRGRRCAAALRAPPGSRRSRGCRTRTARRRDRR